MRTLYVLDLNVPSNALALWLALNQPALFLWVYRRVRRARKVRGLRARFGLSGLGALSQDDFDIEDDDLTDADEGDEEDYSEAGDSTVDDTGVATPTTETSANQTLGLVPVQLSDTQALTDLDPSLLTPDTDSGSQTLTAAGQSTSPDGTSIAGCASMAGDSTQSALGQVGSALTSTAALSALAGAAAGYFLANGDSAGAATTGVQLANVAAGNAPAPITTTTSADGSTTAALETTNADGSTSYTPLSEEDLSLLSPSSATVFLAQYGVYIAAFGAAALLLILNSRHRRGHR